MEPPQIKDLKLFIPKRYAFLADNTIFIALGIPDKYLENTAVIKSNLPPGSYKTSLDTPSGTLSLHCKEISKVTKVKNEFDGQPSSFLASIHLFNYKATSPIDLVFLELYTDRPCLDFKILDENNDEVIPRTFYLQLLNKE